MILGSGTSLGVPQIGCRCEVCRSEDPKDKRTRVSALFELGGTRILIDTPPEIRLQLVANDVCDVDAVLYTHDHADHLHGIDDLRAISIRKGRLPLYGTAPVLERITDRFSYIFDKGTVVPKGTFKPELDPVTIDGAQPFEVCGHQVVPILVDHGVMPVLGFRVGDAAYLTDVKTISEAGMKLLDGVRVLVLNALFEKQHPTHLSVPEAIELGTSVGAEQVFFTHLPHTRSHWDLADRLPKGFEPAYDGLSIELY